MLETYFVRNFPLHKINVRKSNGKTIKSKQTVMPGEEVKLTAEEAKQFEHLIEKPEVKAAREKATKKTTTKKEA